MARHSKTNYRDFYQMIAAIIAIITITVKFLIEVNKRGLWKECIISVAIFAGVNYLTYNLQDASIINPDWFLITLIVSIIAFCTYWGIQFNRGGFNQFTKYQIQQNSMYWQEASWWWSLDGWQFEQEVAKVFITQGYKAHVTKGSGDGGVDIILKNGDYTAIVQCKHYQNPVPPEPIRALWGCKDDFGADEVILVASSGITEGGASFIQNKPNFKVLNLNDIIAMSKMPPVEKVASNSKETTSINQKTTKTGMGRRIDI